MRRAALFLAMTLIAGCGGTTASPTIIPGTPAAATPTGGPPFDSPEGSMTDPAQLCALLDADDFGQFNFVTAAAPDVTSDGPGTAICGYANGIFLEAYADTTPEDAQETYRTILENAPFAGEAVQLPGADEAVLDTQMGEDSAGIAVRADRLSFTIGLPASESVETQLVTLAGLVIQRAGGIVQR